MEWALRALGLFYALSGVLYARSFGLEGVLDKALHSLKVRQSDNERARAILLKAMAALTVASGLALLTVSSWIAPFMILNTLVQGAWLIWSRTAFPPQDEAEALGRRRTRNAFVVWLLATAFALSVVWSGQTPVAHAGAGYWLAPVGGLSFMIWLVMQ